MITKSDSLTRMALTVYYCDVNDNDNILINVLYSQWIMYCTYFIYLLLSYLFMYIELLVHCKWVFIDVLNKCNILAM